MAKRQTATATAPHAKAARAAAGQALKRAAVFLSREGWDPADARRSITGAVTRAVRELWPKSESDRDRVTAAAHAVLRERLQRRYAGLTVDEWEGSMYREPEEVVALVGSPSWPWALGPMQAHSPQESTAEAFMVLQRVNGPTTDAETLRARTVAAFPGGWLAPERIAELADDVIGHTL